MSSNPATTAAAAASIPVTRDVLDKFVQDKTTLRLLYQTADRSVSYVTTNLVEFLPASPAEIYAVPQAFYHSEMPFSCFVYPWALLRLEGGGGGAAGRGYWLCAATPDLFDRERIITLEQLGWFARTSSGGVWNEQLVSELQQINFAALALSMQQRNPVLLLLQCADDSSQLPLALRRAITTTLDCVRLRGLGLATQAAFCSTRVPRLPEILAQNQLTMATELRELYNHLNPEGLVAYTMLHYLRGELSFEGLCHSDYRYDFTSGRAHKDPTTFLGNEEGMPSLRHKYQHLLRKYRSRGYVLQNDLDEYNESAVGVVGDSIAPFLIDQDALLLGQAMQQQDGNNGRYVFLPHFRLHANTHPLELLPNRPEAQDVDDDEALNDPLSEYEACKLMLLVLKEQSTMDAEDLQHLLASDQSVIDAPREQIVSPTTLAAHIRHSDILLLDHTGDRNRGFMDQVSALHAQYVLQPKVWMSGEEIMTQENLNNSGNPDIMPTLWMLRRIHFWTVSDLFVVLSYISRTWNHGDDIHAKPVLLLEGDFNAKTELCDLLNEVFPKPRSSLVSYRPNLNQEELAKNYPVQPPTYATARLLRLHQEQMMIKAQGDRYLQRMDGGTPNIGESTSNLVEANLRHLAAGQALPEGTLEISSIQELLERRATLPLQEQHIAFRPNMIRSRADCYALFLASTQPLYVLR